MFNKQVNPWPYILMVIVAFWIGCPYGIFIDPHKGVTLIQEWALKFLFGIYAFIILGLIFNSIAYTKKWVMVPIEKVIMFFSAVCLSFITGLVIKTTYTCIQSFFV